MLALLVHIAFFALLIFGITWQAQEPAGVVVELWSDLPAPETRQVIEPVEPPPPPPPPEPIKKAPPKPVVAPPPTKAPGIALKEKRLQEEKHKQELLRQEKLKQEKQKQDQQKQEQAHLVEVARQQQAEMAKRAQAQQAAALQTIKGEYVGRIQSKIRGKLNKTLCGDGKPQLEFDLALLPTGQLRGNPILRKSSGIAACDRAVENAILQSEPLPVPSQPEAFGIFRELHLVFTPNE